MKPAHFSVGIDIASQTFMVSIATIPGEVLHGPKSFDNTPTGQEELLVWLNQHQIKPEKSIICMEATGVYGESLCYFLHRHHYPIVVESPLKVKRAFKIDSHKTDAVDSIQIAEYGLRFFNRLTLWEPREAMLEELSTLLSLRELLVQQKTQAMNHLHSLDRKAVKSPAAQEALHQHIAHLAQQIKTLEEQINQVISQNPRMQRYHDLLKNAPGVGLLLTASLMVMTRGFTQKHSVRQAASYLKLAPLKHESGTSVFHKPRTPHCGPPVMRKLLHLAARSVVTHRPEFKHYYLRKQAEGKPKRLILNNVENKLLKIIWAIIRDGKPYIPNYQSVHPKYWKTA